ncbi:MAG TPA: cytochrome c [Pyrinomonadaceae bacterium]|jgi:mono/diheme cytochrome c family protein
MLRARDLRLALKAAAACLALAAAAGCDARGGRSGPAAAAADRTRALYDRSCATCHGPQGEGKQVGTMNVPSLRQGAALNDPDERLFSQIADGGRGMPPFKYTLDDRQIEDLVRFVREEIQKR